MQVIATHKNVDFDAIASVFAAKILYPEAVPTLPNHINPNVRSFLAIHKDHFAYSSLKEIDHKEVTRLIVVDANRWNRLEGSEGYEKKTDLEVHLWDHHGADGDLGAHWECSESVGAATTLLVKEVKERSKEISPIQATLFLAGIYEDTGNLTFPSTSPDDAKAVGFLLDHKADLNMLQYFLRPAYGPRQKEILFEMLKEDERRKVNGYTISLKSIDIHRHTPGLALVVDMYRDIVNVDAVFGIFREEKKKQCIVIGRSASDDLNMGTIMRQLGGGGNPNAGSVMLKSTTPEVVEERIMGLVTEHQGHAAQVGDLMSFPVFSVSPDTSMKEVAGILREKGCTGLPVVVGDHVVGIISRRDFKKVKKESSLKAPVRAFMSTRVAMLAPDSSITQAAGMMVKDDIGRLPVVEENKLIGIITRSDTMRYYYDLLPDEMV